MAIHHLSTQAEGWITHLLRPESAEEISWDVSMTLLPVGNPPQPQAVLMVFLSLVTGVVGLNAGGVATIPMPAQRQTVEDAVTQMLATAKEQRSQMLASNGVIPGPVVAPVGRPSGLLVPGQ